MKRFLTVCAVFGAGAFATSISLAAAPQLSPPTGQDTTRSYIDGRMASYFEDEAADKEKAATEKTEEPAEATDAKTGCGCESSSECGSSCDGCGNGCGNGCGSSCGCNDGCSLFGDCCLGEPWTLKDCLTPCCCGPTYGGWLAVGYYSDNDRLSFQPNDLLSFWDNPDQLNLDQAWFYVEKLAEADACSPDCGYRFDMLYGVDAQKTQAFGNSGYPAARGWDNQWDHGEYGWAIPQLYAEVAYGDWNAKVGHFFTPIGYEVIPATGNFFYSHSYTMFNSEPFTHTGVLGTYSASDDVTLYVGWTLGWDTGYDQFGNGSNFLGGFATQLNDDVKYTYLCTAGDLGWRGDGYSHSNVVDFALSNDWQYVLQSDLATSNQQVVNGADNLSYGVNNYLFYSLNDCWKLGGRAEWWKSNQVTGEMASYYAITGGINYKATANLIIRPEVKYNWTPSDEAVDSVVGEDFNQTLFGIDAIFTF